MAYRVCFIRVPKHKNITFDQIELINTYFEWKKECDKKGEYACDTFKEWCGHEERELPDKIVIDYYKKFDLSNNKYFNENLPDYNCSGVIEYLAKISKASQIFYWIVRRKMGVTKIETMKEYHSLGNHQFELNRDDLEDLLLSCIQVRKYGIEYNKNGVVKYKINEEVAKALLPIIEVEGQLAFPYEYSYAYAEQINNTIKLINEIVSTTDFDLYTIFCLYV